MTVRFNFINLINLLKISTIKLRFQYKEPIIKKALEKNQLLKGAYKGKRCFIIGTGPSIAKQDLSLIADETCLGLNSFYLHPEYPNLKDVYHVITGFLLHTSLNNSQTKNEEDALNDQWFKELKGRLSLQSNKNRRFFVNFPDKEIIERNLSYVENQIFYTYFPRNIEDIEIYGINASLPLYAYHSVSVMALQIAIHMGFDNIYLLGLDHDWIIRYAEKSSHYHFYNPKDSVFEKDYDQGSNINWGNEFYSHHQLWQQYRLIGNFCSRNNISIYNCTEGGLLDVFPRISLKSVING